MPKKLIIANKLIRDKIPEIIKKDGGEPIYFQIFGYPLRRALFNKIYEELDELKQTNDSNCCLEELADVYEVFLNIVKSYCFDIQDVIHAADIKREEKGGFDHHFFLKKYIRNDNNSNNNDEKEINKIFDNKKNKK